MIFASVDRFRIAVYIYIYIQVGDHPPRRCGHARALSWCVRAGAARVLSVDRIRLSLMSCDAGVEREDDDKRPLHQTPWVAGLFAASCKSSLSASAAAAAGVVPRYSEYDGVVAAVVAAVTAAEAAAAEATVAMAAAATEMVTDEVDRACRYAYEKR